jgi:hypothetical protein
MGVHGNNIKTERKLYIPRQWIIFPQKSITKASNT